MGTNQESIRALLYTFDLSTNRVVGSPLANELTSAVQSDNILSVTFSQPVQLSPATPYAIILTTSGQGQGFTSLTIYLQRSNRGTPNEIPGGLLIYQASGDNVEAIERDPFYPINDNLFITVA